MSDGDPFENELRITLAALAREPAPETLLVKVAAIPAAHPMGRPSRWSWSRPAWRGAAGLAFAVLALVFVIGSLALLPGGFLGNGASPSTFPTVSPAASPSPTASPTASPTVSVPSPTATPTGAEFGPLPADFRPKSVTFVSSSEGWVLGGTGCTSDQCPTAVIAHTLDGGRTWTRRPAPPASVLDASLVAHSLVGTSGISGLRFADPLDGWAFGPELWATHDGGSTWHRVTIDGNATLRVLVLEAAHGTVNAVINDTSASSGFGIATSPVGSDAWRVASVTMPYGAGPVPELQLVLAGSAGWILQNDRVVTNGARLVQGAWKTWQPPCVDVNGPARLAASSATQLVAACLEGVWGPAPGGGPVGEHLYASTDGGTSFARTAAAIPLDDVAAIAAPTSSTVVAGGALSTGNDIVISRDGGRTWSTVLRLGGAAAVSYLGFTTPTQGVLITTRDMRMTYDGGRTWRIVAF